MPARKRKSKKTTVREAARKTRRKAGGVRRAKKAVKRAKPKAKKAAKRAAKTAHAVATTLKVAGALLEEGANMTDAVVEGRAGRRSSGRKRRKR